jgi:hypothetical protein
MRNDSRMSSIARHGNDVAVVSRLGVPPNSMKSGMLDAVGTNATANPRAPAPPHSSFQSRTQVVHARQRCAGWTATACKWTRRLSPWRSSKLSMCFLQPEQETLQLDELIRGQGGEERLTLWCQRRFNLRHPLSAASRQGQQLRSPVVGRQGNTYQTGTRQARNSCNHVASIDTGCLGDFTLCAPSSP